MKSPVIKCIYAYVTNLFKLPHNFVNGIETIPRPCLKMSSGAKLKWMNKFIDTNSILGPSFPA